MGTQSEFDNLSIVPRGTLTPIYGHIKLLTIFMSLKGSQGEFC